MPLPNTVRTGALLIATGLAAAGLNLGVLAIGDDRATTGAGTGADAVQLTAAASVPLEPAAAATTGLSNDEADAATVVVPSSTGPASTDGPPTPAPASNAASEPAAANEVTAATESTASSASSVTSTTVPIPTVGEIEPTTTAPATTTPATIGPAPSASEMPPLTEYLTYEFPGVATIIVALHDGRRLEFWSVTTAPGWAYRVDDDDGSKVKIKFRPLDGGDEAEWELKREGGRLTVKQEY